MILIDFSGIAFGNAIVKEGNLADSRVVLLTRLAYFNKKYRDFGQLVICCDNGSWRKKVFKHYKAARKTHRDNSEHDWPKIFENVNTILEEIKTNLPWKVISIETAEGDDIIGSLVRNTQDFGNFEPVMIIAGDHDYIQCQRYGNVKQWSPITKKMVKTKAGQSPTDYIREHVIRGDGGDGIPNVLSDDDTFVSDDKKQAVMTAGRLENILKHYDSPEDMTPEVRDRFLINRQCIDFEYIPEDLYEEIINTYTNYKLPHRSKVLNYLVKSRCKTLIEKIEDIY